jgi:hypothetical protein
MPERSQAGGNSAMGNRSVTNMALATGKRSSMNFGPSRFGNAGLFAHTNLRSGSFNSTGSNGFGRGGNSFSGGSFSGGGSRFGNGGGLEHAGFGHSWNGRGYRRAGYGGHYGYGHGYGHYGYSRWGYRRGWGYGPRWGYGWGPGWGGGWGWSDGWWFLDDLFGLALNATSLALNPWSPFATLGADLIGDGVQALGNLDNNDNGGGNYDGDQGSFGGYSNDPGYYDNSNYADPPYRQPYQRLCGTEYSAENPGCVQ